MVTVDVAVDDAGLLVSCAVSGHAQAGPAGQDLVCAAVSILTRTAFRTLSDREGIELRGGAPERGVFWMETGCLAAARGFLSGAGAYLIEGFRSLAETYPEYLRITIKTKRRN